MKMKCTSMEAQSSKFRANMEHGGSGREYEFHLGGTTDVDDLKDVQFFLHAGFTAEGMTADDKKALEDHKNGMVDKAKDQLKRNAANGTLSDAVFRRKEILNEVSKKLDAVVDDAKTREDKVAAAAKASADISRFYTAFDGAVVKLENAMRRSTDKEENITKAEAEKMKDIEEATNELSKLVAGDIPKEPVKAEPKPVSKPEPEPVKESKPEPEPKPKYTEKELFAMDKDQQVALIKELDDKAEIPKYEKDRVALILKIGDK